MSQLSVDDPVHVSREASSQPPLEGIVAYAGPVEFGAAAEREDWVGVRLTGSSAGLGKNDGSVQGRQYFQCPELSGMFVRSSKVSKRSLTRLEELRLRRELNTGTSAAGRKPGIASPSAKTPIAGRTRSAVQSGAAAPASADKTSSSTARTSKLEELRRRRAALKAESASKDGGTKSTPPKPAAAGTTTRSTTATAETRNTTPTAAAASSPRPTVKSPSKSSRSPDLHAEWQKKLDQSNAQIEDLTEKLRDKEVECSSLQQKLSLSEQEVHDARTNLQKQQEEAAAKIEIANKLAEEKASADSAGASATTSSSSNNIPEETQQELQRLEQENGDLKDRLDQVMQEATSSRRDLELEREGHNQHMDELTESRSRVTALQQEVLALSEQKDQRGASDAFHYKERAKLQTEMSACKRKVEQLGREKLELENNLEDIALDKEQLQDEKEALEDRLDELKLDAETAQMEAEELRIELEDAQAAMEKNEEQQHLGDTAGDHGGAGGDAEDMAQALAVQNTRLRDALIRLREQSSVEKMELSRQLRAAEKDAEAGQAVMQEVEASRSNALLLQEQINDLKDMVEQGAAFEGMVEELSDRVLSLEEDAIVLQATIREMEEAAELTAEMEEVQNDELKAVTRDLEGRDTIIHNLEQAIKMQRRREEDFKRTVGNYRTAVDTLKQEKQALLEIQQGGEGEKSGLIEASQKALARAAELVSDAAESRKRESQAVVDKIDCQVYKHLSRRLEELLPQAVVASEVSAVKGELMVCNILGKASQSLRGIAQSCGKNIRPGLPEVDEANLKSDGSDWDPTCLSDDTKADVVTVLHQGDFAHVIAEASSGLLRLLAAGQWPDILSKDSSTELGSILGHSIAELDSMLGSVLKSLKEEGVLTPEQSNIDALRQTVETTIQGLRSEIEREDSILVPASWNPPGLELFKDASHAKFDCLCATSAMSTFLNQADDKPTPPAVAALYNKLEQGSSQATNACARLAMLDVRNDKLVEEMSASVKEWKAESKNMLAAVRELLLSSGNLQLCQTTAGKTLRLLAKLSSALRSAKLNQDDENRFHALSPEADDAWENISRLARSTRSIDGDKDDVNFLARAHVIERRLGDAVENEPKLALANTKISSLEKSLSSRSKEIAMQNARLSELEKLVAKSSANPLARGKTAELKASEEINSLKEENRVLTEAMDVMQRQVDDYENDIRALKDFKSPKGASGRRGPGRRPMTSIGDLTPQRKRVSGGLDELPTSTGAFEAALFRPALQRALCDAARWRAAATGAAILDLPPLPVSSTAYLPSEEMKTEEIDQADSDLVQLNSALVHYRIEKASVKLVDLNHSKSPRAQLREMKMKHSVAAARLESVVLKCRAHLS